MKVESGHDEKEALLQEEGGTSFLQALKGTVLSFTAVFFFTTFATCVQLLERRIPDFELNAFRFGIPLLFYVIKLLIRSEVPKIDRDKWAVTIGYTIAAFVSSFTYFVSVSLLARRHYFIHRVRIGDHLSPGFVFVVLGGEVDGH